ncbi:MAG: serine hydroxymethyltransferase [Thermoplasmataceae archaeon]
MSEILKLVKKHEKYRSESLNLQASENIMSANAREALSSDLASRYSLVLDPSKGDAYGGTRYTDEILHETEKLAASLYGSKFAEVRPLGGHIAAEMVILSLMSKRENMMSIAEKDGGYTGYQNGYLPQMFGFQNYEIPYDAASQEINLQKLERAMKASSPSLVLLGQSFFLKHYDLKPLREMCDAYNSYLAYDGSHVMGLIAGKAFQKDALEYCDLLFGSTHKSFFGPQGGIILTNNEDIFSRIRKNITWRTMDNYHPSRIAALGVALEEMTEYGRDYAASVVKNSVHLGRELHDSGVGVKFSPWYSETHQIALDINYFRSRGMNFESASQMLEENGIIIDREGRIGTSEISRMGFSDMGRVAELINLALSGKNVRQEVSDLIKELRIHYTGA